MINHIVMWKWREDLPAEEREKIIKELPFALGALPTVRNFRMGQAIILPWKTRISPFEFMFSMDFEDEKAMSEYMEAHRDFARTRLRPAMAESVSSVSVDTILWEGNSREETKREGKNEQKN